MASTAAFALDLQFRISSEFTSWPSSSDRRFATGAKDSSGFVAPFGFSKMGAEDNLSAVSDQLS